MAKLLENAAAEGRLTPDEAGERLAAASAATYREDLAGLIADLPAVRDPDIEQRIEPRGAWWLFGAFRVAFVVTLVVGLWGVWGIRLFWWPLGFMAVAFFLRPWRRRRWGGRWYGWQRA